MKIIQNLQTLDKKVPGKILIICYLIFVVFSYVFLNIGFKPELFDNTWTHYWAFDFVNNGFTEDRLRGDGLANLNITGMTPAYIYGNIMNVIGWELPKALLISTILVLSGLGFWSLILKEWGWSTTGRFVFVTMGLLLDVFFEPAHTSKTDAFTFFMLSFSFFLFVKEKYLPAGLAALICFESHPIGLTVFFYMLGHFLGNREEILKKGKIKPFLLFGVGMLLGVIYYLLLHYNSLFNSSYSLSGNLQQNPDHFYFSSYIYKYFFSGKFGRHIPELGILVIGWLIGLKMKFYKKAPGIYWILLLVIVSSILNPRQVHTYVIMAFPALALVTIDTAERLKIQKLVLLSFFILMLPQYLLIFNESRTWPPHKAYVETIRTNLPEDKSIPILGSALEWFACVGERPYYHTSRLGYAPDFRPEKLYMVVEDDGRKDGVTDLYRSEYRYNLIHSFVNHGEDFEIYEMILH